jgi:predicted permease
MAGGITGNGVIPEGKPINAKSVVIARLQIVSPGYFPTMRIMLKAGRDFAPSETRSTRLIAIVNETLARTLWPGQDAIGKRFACCEAGPKGDADPAWHEVVGVAADVRAEGLNKDVLPQFYLPVAQIPSDAWDWISRTMDLVVRTKAEAVPMSELQAAVASVAPGVPLYQASTMRQKIAGTIAKSHFETFLLTIFAAAALLLSSVGIYGVLSFMVAERTREIGVRIALGATHARVVREVMGHGFRLAVLGLAMGLAGALAGTRLLSSLLFGVHPTDALTFAAVSLLLVAVALAASYLPARRAAHVDPMIALRHE